MDIKDIKLKEIQLFLNLTKLKSVRELGRQVQMQPGQISKWIQGLEKKVGHPLIERSAKGIRPTAKALELMPQFERLNDLMENLAEYAEGGESGTTLSLASASFLSTYFIPLVLKEMKPQDLKVRMVDLPPTHFIAAALRGAFEFCIHSQVLDWPQTWTTTEVGSLLWQVYARKAHPIHKASTLREVLTFPFVIPIYWTSEGIQYGDDGCPIPLSKRKRGHETATATSAAEVMKVTDQLGFLPDIVAKRHSLKAVKIHGIKSVRKPIYLSVKNSSVKQRQFEMVSQSCREVVKSFSL